MFIRAEPIAALFLLRRVNTVFKGNLFTHVRRPLPPSPFQASLCPGFCLQHMENVSLNCVELCKQAVSSLLSSCLTLISTKAADIKCRRETKHIMSLLYAFTKSLPFNVCVFVHRCLPIVYVLCCTTVSGFTSNTHLNTELKNMMLEIVTTRTNSAMRCKRTRGSLTA